MSRYLDFICPLGEKQPNLVIAVSEKKSEESHETGL